MTTTLIHTAALLSCTGWFIFMHLYIYCKLYKTDLMYLTTLYNCTPTVYCIQPLCTTVHLPYIVYDFTVQLYIYRTLYTTSLYNCTSNVHCIQPLFVTVHLPCIVYNHSLQWYILYLVHNCTCPSNGNRLFIIVVHFSQSLHQ